MKKTGSAVIPVIVILTILGAFLLVQTNSRSSILIKEAVYVAGASLALLAGALHMILSGRVSSGRVSRAMLASFMLLLFWLVFRHFTGIRSVNGPKYIFSTLSLGALVLMMALYLKDRYRDLILWVLVISAGVLSIYAILQSMGVIIFSWDAGLTQSARSSGTMGNANLLGSFSMAMIPVGLGFIMSRPKLARMRYVVAGLFTVLCMAALLASKTRGSLLGILALLLATPFIPAIRRNRKRLALVLLAFMLLLTVSVVALSSRMEELASTGEGTLQVRKLIWSGSLSMWMANPLLGYGPGSFQIQFPQFRDPNYFLLGVSHNTLHAHCEYIEILIDSGVIGLLLWLLLAFSIYSLIRRNRHSVFPDESAGETGGNGWTAIGLAGGILALAAEAAVSVALRWPTSALLMALFTGLLLACVPAGSAALKGYRRYGSAAVMTAVALFLAFSALPEYSRSMRAGSELFEGKDMYLTNIQVGIDKAVSAAIEWSGSGDQQAAERAIYFFNSSRDVADSSRKYCEMCVQTDPGELGGWYALGSAYVSSARLYQQISPPLTALMVSNGIQFQDDAIARDYMLQSLAAYDSLTARAPDYAEIHNNLTLVWISLGDADSALAHMRRAWDLHAHNRNAYIGRVRILNPLTRSVDGVYIKWLTNLQPLQLKLPAEGSQVFRTTAYDLILFDFGTTFYRFPDKVDSLAAELEEILLEQENPEIRSIAGLIDTQVSHMDQGLRLAAELEAGDTVGVASELSEIPPETLDILPVQRALQGIVESSEGDVHGMQLLVETVRGILWNGIDDLMDFPVDVGSMLEHLEGSIIAGGLDSPEKREILYRHLKNLLDLDRSIFEIVTFIETSSALAQNAGQVEEQLRGIWADIGGPMYSYVQYSGEGEAVPVFAPGSLLEEEYMNLSSLLADDSLDADMRLMEIQWLFVYFASSYSGIPHYSNYQAGLLVSMLADSRDDLVLLLGESETQYRLGWMLSNLYDSDLLEVTGEFVGYLDALRSDLTMGSITRPDLP